MEVKTAFRLLFTAKKAITTKFPELQMVALNFCRKFWKWL